MSPQASFIYMTYMSLKHPLCELKTLMVHMLVTTFQAGTRFFAPMQWRVTRLLLAGVLETNWFQDRVNMYHLHLEILCARHQKLFTGRHPGNSAQCQDRSQHSSRGSFVCSFLMRDAVDVKVMSLTYCIDHLCRPSTGARAASSTLLSSRACPEVLSIAPTLRELGATIPLSDSLSKDLCRVSKEPYTLFKNPCSLSQLNYGTTMLVALVVGTLG